MSIYLYECTKRETLHTKALLLFMNHDLCFIYILLYNIKPCFGLLKLKSRGM